jgi:hypothetical protein
MRKIISGFVLSLALASVALAATTYTTNYNLAKPSDGSTSWGSSIRDNFDTIDTQLFSSAGSITAHVTDTTGAHAATAISTTAGSLICTSSDDVQEYLDCLDGQVGAVTGGTVVTLSGTQTITGNKTFTGLTSIGGGGSLSIDGTLTLSSLGDGVAKVASGVVSSASLVNADVSASAAIDYSKLATLADGNILVGSGAGVATSVNPSGDIDVSNTGVFSIASGAIVNADVSGSAAIDFSKLATLTSGNILVGSAGNVATSTAVTGDISITNGGVTAYSGTVPLNKGGTGQTTKAAAFDALSPMTASGDIIYGGASGTGTALPKGSDGQFLTLSSGLPAWGSVSNIGVSSVKTSTYAIQTTDDLVLVDGTSAFTATLPTAVGVSGKVYRIKRVDQTLANAVTIATTSSQTIDGVTTRKLMTQYEEFAVVSDGSNWHILDHNYPSVVVAYTPTLVGFGTVSNQTAYWSRSGDRIVVWGSFTAGTPTSTEARWPLPTGLTTAGSSKLPSSTLAIIGRNNGNSTNAGFFSGGTMLGEQSKTYVTFGAETSTLNGVTKRNGDSWVAPGGVLSVFFEVPVDGWEG